MFFLRFVVDRIPEIDQVKIGLEDGGSKQVTAPKVGDSSLLWRSEIVFIEIIRVIASSCSV
jgi:hypothetical protein